MTIVEVTALGTSRSDAIAIMHSVVAISGHYSHLLSSKAPIEVG